VYTSKRPEDSEIGTCVLDFERGLASQIWPRPWQSDTCVGMWHYDRETYEKHQYKTPKAVVDLLVDIVSQNGNLLLNFPLPYSWQLDADELKTLAGITEWMAVNGDGIYGDRPWKIYGEGPSTLLQNQGGALTESKRGALTAEDILFTTKRDSLYSFVMGWPEEKTRIRALGMASPQQPGKIVDVSLLGHQNRLRWVQEVNALEVQVSAEQQPLTQSRSG
jgi:alpha-L-fucosidase